jgi:hypothetical protein
MWDVLSALESRKLIGENLFLGMCKVEKCILGHGKLVVSQIQNMGFVLTWDAKNVKRPSGDLASRLRENFGYFFSALIM